MQTFDDLKAKQRRLREGFPEALGLRVHRALSWLARAEQERARGDRDGEFIFLWIAFNAAYAGEQTESEQPSERSAYIDYFQSLVSVDSSWVIHDALWSKFSGPIRSLLANRYIYGPFWRAKNNPTGGINWEPGFEASKRSALAALGRTDVRAILEIVFDRLYVLRNQIIHGGATWSSSVNRDQIVDGANIMGFLVPTFIDLMMDNPGLDWGRPYYPVVE